MSGVVDLHVHTTASDGTLAPCEVVKLAKEIGLEAIAITDHDTTAGHSEAIQAGEKYNLKVIPGIEISTRFQSAVHILGYYIDQNSLELQTALAEIVRIRDERNEKICQLMREDGFAVEYDSMKKRFGDVIGRPHFATLLVEFGLAADVQDAFHHYVDKGQRYFVPRTFLSLERSIRIIRSAGGIPVLAHPFQYRLPDHDLRLLLEQCIEYGLLGMECLYSGYSADQSAYLTRLAEEFGLLITGGSDFHGSAKPHIQLGTGTGELHVPLKYLNALSHAAHSLQ